MGFGGAGEKAAEKGETKDRKDDVEGMGAAMDEDVVSGDDGRGVG